MLIIKVGGGTDINIPGIVNDLAALDDPFVVVLGANALRDSIGERLSMTKQELTSLSGYTSVYSDEQAIDLIMMTYAGLRNRRFVELCQRQGINAIGLSGLDGRLVQGERNRGIRVREGGKTILKRDFSGKPRDYEVAEVEWDLATVEKGGYDKFMLKEIHEQPEAVRKTLLGRINQEKDGVIFKTQGLDAQRLAQMRKLCIVACGTAFHAGIVGRYLMEYFTDIPVEIDIASEFRYRKPKIDEHTFIMSVSQSGETADTLACIREARRRGCYLLSICNVLGSSIARESDAVIYTCAGPEIGVASTKAYSCQLTAFYLFTIYLAQLKGQMTADKARSLIKELEAVPDKIEAVFRQEKKIRKCAEKYSFVASSLYLGRGFNYPTALEGALKNKEISYIHAEGYPAGEMKHGPISLIDAELPVICICTQGAFYEKMLSNIKEVEARNGRIIAIATEGDTQVAEIAEEVIYVPPTSEVLSPIINIIPLQLFAYYAALARGCDIDKPRNLAKSVTVE